MRLDIWVYTMVLVFINFLFVLGVDRHVRKHVVKTVYQLEPAKGQRAAEIRNGILTTPIHAMIFASLIAAGLLRIGSESVLLAIGTFLLTFVWTEIWHYASHVAMHTRSLHAIHREHHKSRVPSPWSSVSFSMLEKFVFSGGILGVLASASQLFPLSAFGIFSYYCLYFFTNTLGHANFEFRKPNYYKTFLGKVFNTPSYHAMHHARYTKNYGLLTPWLDRAFGTAWEDAPEVQMRAATGKPLRALGERPNATKQTQ